MFGAQVLIIYQQIRKMSYDHKPYIRTIPGAHLRFLFTGDSTAVGTGAQNSTESVAGYFGQAFPGASIDNDSYNGRKLNQLAREFPPSNGFFYDLVVVQIGANDIMKLTSYKSIDQDLIKVIAQAKKVAQHVVILHSGNVGLAPVFIWPFNWIMSERSRKVRQIYMGEARRENVLYVDLFTERNNDLFLKDIPKYYCLDHLHPSGVGYHWWYEKIRQKLAEAKVVL